MKIAALDHKGFSLVELMISVLVFSVLITGILSVQIQGFNNTKRAAYSYTAYNLAKNRLEALRSFSFTDLSSAVENDTLVNGNGVVDPNGIFKRSTAVTDNYLSNADLKEISVTVNYTFKGENGLSPMTMTTVVCSE